LPSLESGEGCGNLLGAVIWIRRQYDRLFQRKMNGHVNLLSLRKAHI